MLHSNLSLFPRMSVLSSVSLHGFLVRTPAFELGPTLTQYDLILTNYIYKDPVSKSGHFLKFWVDMNFVEGLYSIRSLWGCCHMHVLSICIVYFSGGENSLGRS